MTKDILLLTKDTLQILYFVTLHWFCYFLLPCPSPWSASYQSEPKYMYTKIVNIFTDMWDIKLIYQNKISNKRHCESLQNYPAVLQVKWTLICGNIYITEGIIVYINSCMLQILNLLLHAWLHLCNVLKMILLFYKWPCYDTGQSTFLL